MADASNYGRFGDKPDSLDIVEQVMAVEAALDQDLSIEQREYLIRELRAQLEDGSLDPDTWDDDDALGVLVRKLSPKGPPGKFGSAVRPESDEIA